MSFGAFRWVSSRKCMAILANFAYDFERQNIIMQLNEYILEYLPTLRAKATRTITALWSLDNAVIDGSIYSGNTLASLRGISLTMLKQAVSVSMAWTCTLADEVCARCNFELEN